MREFFRSIFIFAALLVSASCLHAQTTVTITGDFEYNGLGGLGPDDPEPFGLNDASYTLTIEFAANTTGIQASFTGLAIGQTATLIITDPTTPTNEGTFNLTNDVIPLYTVNNNFGFGGFSGFNGETTQPLSFDGPIADFGVLLDNGQFTEVLSNAPFLSTGDVIGNETFNGTSITNAENLFGNGPTILNNFYNSTNTVVTTAVAAPLLGDVNQDGFVNFLDISPFIALLTTGEFQEEADIDQNGFVNFLDISPFIAILSGQ